MFKWVYRLLDWYNDRAFDNAFWYSKRHYGRFPDGRKYYTTWDGAMGLCLDDPQTIEAIQKKFKEVDDAMRISQPHMYDKDGKFIGGILRMSNNERLE